MQKNNQITALAQIHGGPDYPGIRGTVTFRQMNGGVLVTAQIYNLPHENSEQIFAFHIHEGTSCSGNTTDVFADAGGHYNPNGKKHPHHAGDLPPLFGNNGYAYMSVFTDRFTVREVIGRVIIIHEKADDFTTQPAGNAGKKIACGKIV